MATTKAVPLLGDVIDSLGFGFAQLRAGFIGGGVYFADGSEMLVISSVSDAVAEQWGLAPAEKGLIVSMVFVGVLLGNLVSGPISDTWGRRHIVIVNFVGLFIFSIWSGWARNLAEICILRLLVGFFFGFGQPAWNALGAEMTPSNRRVMMMGLSQTLFVAGEIYSCLLLMADDPTLKNIHWRRLVQLAAIPAGVEAVLAIFFLHQSPSFLAVNDRKDEAMIVLESIRHDNGMKDHPIDFMVATSPAQLKPEKRRQSRHLSYVNKQDAFRQFRVVCGPQYRLTTLITLFGCFTLNLVYYGTMYAFPQIFARSESSHLSGAAELLIGACWEIAGFVSAVAASVYVPRIRAMSLYLLLMIIFLLMFTIGNSTNLEALMNIGFYGIKLDVNIGFVFIYQYSIEVYPTVARTTGHAICLGCGRVASIISPIVYETMYTKTGHTYAFFYLLIAACAANLLMMFFLTIETMGMQLKDDVDDEQLDQETAREAEALTEQDGSKKLAMMPEPFISR